MRGGEPDEGGIAIFESPYSYTRTGSLQYWATVAEMRRFMVQVMPQGEGECEVVVRGPVRRSRRANGVVGMVLSGVGGALGGGLGLGSDRVWWLVPWAWLRLPWRWAWPRWESWAAKSSPDSGISVRTDGRSDPWRSAFQRILGRVERDVRRELELQLPPGR